MYYQKSSEDTLLSLNVQSNNGLTQEEATKRLEDNGPNTLVEKQRKTILQMFLSQLKDTMIYILFAAAAISAILHEVTDAIIILIVVLINAVIGVVQESKAEAALEALKNLSSPTAMVRRNGKIMEIPASQLVVGDIVILEAGRIIPADLRLIQSVNLKIEESALTGESVPVDKDANFLSAKEIGIGDRINMAYSSTSVAYGRGEGVVVYTGMDTEIGKIASMLNESVEELTPLQKRLNDLGKLLGIVAIVIVVAMFGMALILGRDIIEMFITAIALAVAAIPEGLTAVVTIVLALGVQRMVKVNTIVRKLPAVETLGAVSVVCSDKTGTLTQNKMTVTKIYFDNHLKDVSELSYDKNTIFVKGFVLCNDASTANNERMGDPTELALLDMGKLVNVTREGLEQTNPRINEKSFDSARKLMTTVHKEDNKIISYTKGAMDILLGRCNKINLNGEVIDITEQHIANINKAASEMARGALRVLALGYKENDETANEENLTFAGLIGMIDPPRPEAKDSVQVLKAAGITTIMITGDHKDTALAIAKDLGIAENENQCITGSELNELNQEQLNNKVRDLRVFARVSPEHKVMIVKAFKSNGSIVSMTGDGVNDAPSLKSADIGVAMGITGTDVAKGAADMVLTDDNFATIEKAVAEGRGIYQNIKKTVLFLLSSNFGEVISMFSAIAAGLASPLQSIHILWINLITDSLPGLALGVDPKDTDIMNAKPRDPNESLFAHGGLVFTIYNGFMIAALTLGAFLWSPISHLMDIGAAINLQNIKEMLELTTPIIVNGHDYLIIEHAQTYAFTTLGVSQLFHAIGMRNYDKSLFKMKMFDNKSMIAAFIIGLGLQIAVTEIPFLTEVFETSQLTLKEWCNLILISMVPLLSHEIIVAGKNLLRKNA